MSKIACLRRRSWTNRKNRRDWDILRRFVAANRDVISKFDVNTNDHSFNAALRYWPRSAGAPTSVHVRNDWEGLVAWTFKAPIKLCLRTRIASHNVFAPLPHG